ncbi:hypothetical protein ERJ75_001719800 [Trypanosoma vivax]|nr:hypothetical protein ERJ75_001719800 [Trypanosoma vivax]
MSLDAVPAPSWRTHTTPFPCRPFPPHKVRRTTGGNASRHGRVTVSAVRACVASCAWPQDRCRAQCDAASRQSEPATRVAARTGRPQRSLLRAPACPGVFRDAVSVCVVRHASLCCESAAASILLAPPSGHLNPPLSLALPGRTRAPLSQGSAARPCARATRPTPCRPPRGAVTGSAPAAMRVRAQACGPAAQPSSAGPRIAWRRAPQMHGRENGSGRSGVRRASRQHNACSVCRARRRGGRAMRPSDAAEGARWHLRPAAALARAACGHTAAKHGQPRYGERDHRTPASACEKALWQLAQSVAERVAKGRVLEAERWPPEQARRAAAGRTGTAGKQQRRHQEGSQGVGRCRRTAHFEGDWAGSHTKKRWRRAGKRPTNAAPRHCTRRKAGGPQQRGQRTLLPDCLGERDEANAGRRTVARRT